MEITGKGEASQPKASAAAEGKVETYVPRRRKVHAEKVVEETDESEEQTSAPVFHNVINDSFLRAEDLDDSPWVVKLQ